MCREKGSICRDTGVKCRKSLGRKVRDLYLKMQMTEKQQEFRIIEQGNDFLHRI